MLWLQCNVQSVHTTLVSINGTKGPQLTLKKVFNIPWHCHYWQLHTSHYQTCGSVRVKPTLQTAYGCVISRGCNFGAKRTNSKRNYADVHEVWHVKPTALCSTRTSRTNALRLHIANISNRFNFFTDQAPNCLKTQSQPFNSWTLLYSDSKSKMTERLNQVEGVDISKGPANMQVS